MIDQVHIFRFVVDDIEVSILKIRRRNTFLNVAVNNRHVPAICDCGLNEIIIITASAA